MTTPAPSCVPCPAPGTAAGMLLCDTQPDGSVTQFIRVYTANGTYVDRLLDATPYEPTGTIDTCGGTTPGCASPTTPVAVAHLCLADGTPLAVVVQRDCDGTVSAPGWVDLATGTYTEGPVPADAAPCDSTVSGPAGGSIGRLALCDIHEDGTIVGFLRAIGSDGEITDTTVDGAPYEPTGTVQACAAVTASASTAAARSGSAVLLCDVAADGTVTSFLRTITTDTTGEVTVTDTDISGTPYTPTGTVQACDASSAGTPPCAQPTTPVATTGLCLADSTPIAVTIERDCDGAVTRTGWVDLTTGTWSAGAPPAGTRACGETSAFDVSGVLCDVDTDGDVLGLVLIQVERGPDGEVTGVTLLNATDGTPYSLAGTLSVCPSSAAQPEQDLVVLCDIAEDGTATLFMRDYRRDATGAVSGYTDYTLDAQPYTTTGDVGTCAAAADSPWSGRELVELCDVQPDGTAVRFLRDFQRDDTGAVNGFTDHTVDGAPYEPVGVVGSCGGSVEGCPAAFQTECWATVEAAWSYDNTSEIGGVPGRCGSIQGPADSATDPSTQFGCQGGPYTITSWIINGEDVIVPGAEPTFVGGPCGPGDATTPGMHANWAAVLTNLDPNAAWIVDSAPGCAWYVRSENVGADVTYGPMVITGDGQFIEDGTWTLGSVRSCAETRYSKVFSQECDGAVSVTWLDDAGTPVDAPSGTLTPCGACSGRLGDTGSCTNSVQTIQLCDLNPDIPADDQGRKCAVPFLRTLVRDCDGALVSTIDTTLDGVTPYQPVQPVDCSNGTPALVDRPWSSVGVIEDPEGRPQQDFIFTLAREDDPTQTGEVRVQLSTPAGGACGPYDLNDLVFSNAATYTFTLGETARDMSTFVVFLQDFDTFEPVTSFSTPPSRLGGTAIWQGTTVVPSESNGVGVMYWDSPPETISYRINNTGGGTSCTQLAFGGITFEPEGCCGCGAPGSGGEAVVATVRSRVATVTDAAPWTPSGEVTAISATGFAGTWSVADADGGVAAGLPAGLSMSWTAEDSNGLVAPQITADPGGAVVINWTERS